MKYVTGISQLIFLKNIKIDALLPNYGKALRNLSQSHGASTTSQHVL